MSQPVEDPIELLLADLSDHLDWLERVADSREIGDLPVLASAMDVTCERLRWRLKNARDYRALDDTAVIVVGRTR